MYIMQLMTQMQTKPVLNVANKQFSSEEKTSNFFAFLSAGKNTDADISETEVIFGPQISLEEEVTMSLQMQVELLEVVNEEDLVLLKELLLSFIHLVDDEGIELSVDMKDLVADFTEMEDVTDLTLSPEELSILANIIQLFVSEDAVKHPQQNGELLLLLKQFSRLSEEAQEEIYRRLETNVDDKPLKTFQMLVTAMEKRTEMSAQQMYQTDAAVTKADVSKWLEQAFQRYDTSASTQTVYAAPVQGGTTVQMDAIQQYDIHIRSTGKVEEVSQQMVTKLTNVIHKSNFMQQNGMTQLQITLNPVQLGEITVRMMEVNGEMMVKLLVTSSTTKNILESNIHQLKHLFSPHQISIEKNPDISDEEFFHEEEQGQAEEEEMHEEKQQQEDVQSDIDFAQLLQELGKEEQEDDEN